MARSSPQRVRDRGHARGADGGRASASGAAVSASGIDGQQPAAQSKDARSSQLSKEAKSQRSVFKDYLANASEKASSHGSLPSLTGPNSDLEFARKNLRNTYLNLLFSCTFTRSAHGVESCLWIETTHPIVAIYRKYLGSLEKTIASLKVSGSGTGAGAKRGSNVKQQGNSNGGGGSSSTRNAKLNEYARVATEYRKFLLSEETFWQELAARIVHTFKLHEARPMFDALGIANDPDSSTVSSSSPLPASSAGAESSRGGVRTNDVDDIPRNAGSSAGMNRVQGAGTISFVSSGGSTAEAAAQVKAAQIPSNRDRLIENVHKALVCCGDLARYRVQVSDKPVESAAKGGNAKGVAKPTIDYTRASIFYTQARLLLPDNGNPSNQLAVIATSVGDPLSAVHHYYRALCCRVPFETAKPNLETALGKGVEQWARRLEATLHESTSAGAGGSAAREPKYERGWRPRKLREMVAGMEAEYANSDPHAFVEVWKGEFIALHGLFHRKVFFTSLEALNQVVVARFAILVKNRALTPDVISKVVISGLSASWTVRLWRNTPAGNGASSRQASSSRRKSAPEKGKSSTTPEATGKGPDVKAQQAVGTDGDEDDEDDEFLPESFTSEQRQAVHLSIENQLVAHVLEVIRVLLDVGTQETRGILQSARRTTLVAGEGRRTQLPPAEQRVTATFRRILPALRVAIKWVKAHLEYIQRCKDRALTSSQSSGSDSIADMSLSFDRIPSARESDVILAKSRADGGVVESIFTFWRSSVDFINTLRFAFPWDDLPSLDTLGPLGAPALCLEEDLDMRGFSPTKKAMLPHSSGGMGEACGAIGLSQAHPNEEQLMRIADLLIDAKVVAESQTSPIMFDDERNAFMYAVPDSEDIRVGMTGDHSGPSTAGRGNARSYDAGGAAVTETRGMEHIDRQPLESTGRPQGLPDAFAEVSSEGFSESTDDVVDLAMRAVDNRSDAMSDAPDRLERDGASFGDDDDDEEDMILVPAVRDLWTHAQGGQSTDAGADLAGPSVGTTGGERPTHARVQSQALGGARTAQDLLLQVLNGSNQSTGSPQQALGSPHRVAQVPASTHATPAASASAGAIFPHSNSPYTGSPVPAALNAALSPPPPSQQPALLFGGMGGSANSPSGGHRASIWSPGPMDMRTAVAPGQGNIWGPPGSGVGGGGGGGGGGAMPSPNFAAAQAFVNGGFFPPGSGQGPPPPPPPPAHNHQPPNPGPFPHQAQPHPGFTYEQRQPHPSGQSLFDDPFAARERDPFNPYPRNAGR
ncbi:unnamed protein product [Tilletia controversa]|uniref:Protein SMG7 n=1 Tax=Tilletia controversa TaxID=13291 RepID=A0A8X7MX90_9BASI|nr:hypothetical protein CF328_g2149 [Tilletia controversa]KAE8251454.1 hypothetical protein A4X06_0g2675 [Tilletia controversa]CAD6906533.1 unnamed protein product [Tilletia controversa]CAD6971125.1 unnamed protein product [Tilletia controversa]CAD6971491.1 unnamed protein product [Tilletia controversa]